MKRFLSIAVLVLVTVAIGYGQQTRVDAFTAANGAKFNQTDQFYYKSGYTASTANDTTGWISIRGVSNFALLGTANDSVNAVLFYQLRNSMLNVTGSWTNADTLGQDGLGTALVATGATQLLTQVATSTLNGYDEIRFYVDQLSGSGAAGDGTTNIIKFFIYRKP